MVQQITGGRVKLSTNVPVGLRLVGPAAKPGVTDIDAKSAVEAIAKSAGSSLVYPNWSDTRNLSGSGVPDEDVFIAKVTLP